MLGTKFDSETLQMYRLLLHFAKGSFESKKNIFFGQVMSGTLGTLEHCFKINDLLGTLQGTLGRFSEH